MGMYIKINVELHPIFKRILLVLLIPLIIVIFPFKNMVQRRYDKKVKELEEWVKNRR